MTDSATDPLRDWLHEYAGLSGSLSISQITGGLSNVTLVAADATGRRLVLRRPPYGAHGGGAHSVLREARIMTAVAPFGVPVPHVVATCDDETVQGAPFFVMDFVDGLVVETTEVLTYFDEAVRMRLSTDLVDVLVAVQSVDLEAAGLSDLVRATPYLERTLRRWRSQWEAIAARELPELERVATRLEELAPRLSPQPDVLVHGDFRFGNVMIGQGSGPAIVALLDWELSTVGHPLADLGFLGARIHAGPDVLPMGVDPSSAPGCLTYDELSARFSARTGVSTDDLPVFVALAAWRWAIIAEGVHLRLLSGEMGEIGEDAAWHGRRAELLTRLAADWLP